MLTEEMVSDHPQSTSREIYCFDTVYFAVDPDRISTEAQEDIAISATKGLEKDVNISRVTLPASLKYEYEDTIIDSSEEIELEEDIVVQDNESTKEDTKSSPHYARLIKNVRDEGMEGGILRICIK